MQKVKDFLGFVLHTFIGSVLIKGIAIILAVHPSWSDTTFYSALVNVYQLFLSFTTIPPVTALFKKS